MKIKEKLDFSSVFMIGIGGISMSGLAKLLLKNNIHVSGSDTTDSNIIQELKDLGIEINIGHDERNIHSKLDLVVYTGAINESNCEIKKAKYLGIKVIERSELLGIIARQFDHVIAISGTHGKTTTTAMIGEIFVSAGFDPTIHLGGKSTNLQTNTYIGSDNYLIVEACEYRNSFASLHPECAVILNIESDHLDYYKDYNAIKLSFDNFAVQSTSLITNKDCNINHNNIQLIDDYSIKNLIVKDKGYNYDVYYNDELLIHIRLNMIGLHNVYNSLYAIAVARKYAIDCKIISSALGNFRGVDRRYEKIGYINNIPIIIDYAHHPTEIKTSFQGIKSFYKNPYVVFQPHTYSRTISLMNDFVAVLEKINNLILFKTYSAREKEIIGGRAEDLFDKLKCKCSYVDNIEGLLKILSCNNKSEFDCILVLGAGDLADCLKSYLSSHNRIVKQKI